MPLNPHTKGGADVPVTDGGTGSSTGAGALSNLGGLDETAHDLLDHTGLTGVGDLTTVAHSSLNHAGIVGVGKVVQAFRAQYTSTWSTAAVIPFDGTVPLASEGANIPGISVTFAPNSTSNWLEFTFTTWGSQVPNHGLALTLVRDGVASVYATQCWGHASGSSGNFDFVTFHAYVQVPSTASQTWRIKAGVSNGAGTWYMNYHSGVAYFGASSMTAFTVKEIAP